MKRRKMLPSQSSKSERLVDPSRTGLVSKIIQNTGWLLGAKGIGAILSLVYLGLTTRTLGPESFGQFVLILGIGQGVAAMVNFQTWQLVVRYGVQHLSNGHHDRLGRLLLICLGLDIGGAVIGAGLAVGVISLLGPMFDWPDSTQQQALYFAFVLLISFRSTAMGILRLHDRFDFASFADAVTPVARMIGAIIVVFTYASITGFLVAWAVAEMLTALAFWLTAAMTIGPERQTVQTLKVAGVITENPGFWRFASLTNAASILNVMSSQTILVFVGLFAGPASAGAFRLAHQLGQALSKLAATFSRGAFPELVRADASTVSGDMGRLFKRATMIAAGGALIIVFLLIIIGKPALVLIAGYDYENAYIYLIFIGTAAAIDLIGFGFEPALFASGRPGRAVALRSVSTLFLIITSLVLLTTYGATGAAIAVLAAATFNLCLFVLTTWRLIVSD